METIDLGTTTTSASKTKDVPVETNDDPWGSFGTTVKKDKTKKASPFSLEAEPEPVVQPPPPEPVAAPEPEPAATEDPWGFTAAPTTKKKKGKKGKVCGFSVYFHASEIYFPRNSGVSDMSTESILVAERSQVA
jgi:hypothetical protein